MFSRHIRSFTFLLPLLLIVLVGCSVSNPSSVPTTSARHKLVVYVVGLGEHLNTHENTRNSGYGYTGTFYDPGHIQPFLQRTVEFKDAASLVFSYDGFTADGKPNTFTCAQTYNNSIADDADKLKKQISAYITVHRNTDVYIVSHSLGSVVAFSFLTSLMERTQTNTLGNNSYVKGISLNDGPIGGIPNNDNYLNTIVLNSFGCGTSSVDYTSIGQLEALFTTTSDEGNRGATASVYNALLNGGYVANQEIAVKAMNIGVAIVSIGNLDDLLWRPDVCINTPSFPSTQFLSEVGPQPNGGAIYSRAFEQGTLSPLDCGMQLAVTKAHHMDVLTRPDVQQAIYEAFAGRNVSQLDVVNGTTFMPIPTPTSIPQPVPTPSLSPTAGTGGKWSGFLTYYHVDRAPDAIILSLPALPPEDQDGSQFSNGTWEAPNLHTVVVANGTMGSRLDEFTSEQQSELSDAMAIWHVSNPRKYLVFFDPDFLSGDQLQLNCFFAAVLRTNGSWVGVWHYPGDNSPDGGFTISPV